MADDGSSPVRGLLSLRANAPSAAQVQADTQTVMIDLRACVEFFTNEAARGDSWRCVGLARSALSRYARLGEHEWGATLRAFEAEYPSWDANRVMAMFNSVLSAELETAGRLYHRLCPLMQAGYLPDAKQHDERARLIGVWDQLMSRPLRLSRQYVVDARATLGATGQQMVKAIGKLEARRRQLEARMADIDVELADLRSALAAGGDMHVWPGTASAAAAAGVDPTTAAARGTKRKAV
jgi:hypothetical protein